MDTVLFASEDPDARQQALERLLQLKERTRRHGGEFVFLWHNSRLGDRRLRDLYRDLLSR